MDSTLTPTPSLNASATKLPIKRKTPATDSNHSTHPVSDPIPNFSPPISAFKTHNDNVASVAHGGDPKPPPFKFHRIWTEPDEIRFLRGLLSCASDKLSFPRDLNVFYSRFSSSMPQPYTRSQLSEKLRRLRKKYRLISTRLSKGLDQYFLSPHDLALYELSKQLWHPDYAEVSPFGGGSNSNNKPQNSDLVGVKVNFLPSFPSDSNPYLVENLEPNCENNGSGADDHGFGNMGFDEEVKLREVNVEFEEEEEMAGNAEAEVGTGKVTVKAIMDVFDESLKEVRMGFLNKGSSLDGGVKEEWNRWNFERRLQEQTFAELEALGRRMRLVLEQSLLQRQ